MSDNSMRLKGYKDSIARTLMKKYSISEFEARAWIREYDFNSICKKSNYLALHDDPEVWADAIYEFKNENDEDLLQM